MIIHTFEWPINHASSINFFYFARNQTPGLFQKLIGHIAGKEKKLANANFVDRAPAEVVEKERESLGQLREQLEAVEKSLAALA